MKGKLIVLNGKGHEVVVEDKKKAAMKLFEEGYRFWENNSLDETLELGNPVKPEKIIENKNYVAMKRIVGG